jgi:hypothetical protein
MDLSQIKITFSASLRNNVEQSKSSSPIGNISSPLFGKTVTLSIFGPLPGIGRNAGAGTVTSNCKLWLTF